MVKEKWLYIKDKADVIEARRIVRQMAMEMGFDEVSQARLALSISELASNIWQYAGDGMIYLAQIEDQHGRLGMAIEAVDNGPGISDVHDVLEKGYRNRAAGGAGLAGVRRVMDQFTIYTKKGKGTRIRAVKWLNQAGKEPAYER